MSRKREGRTRLFNRIDKLEPVQLGERINNAIWEMNQKYQ